MPCRPNKLRGRICLNCEEYDPITKRILIIKLGALGDVIRTTPLIARYRSLYPGCHITWITNSPDILPADSIDSILPFDFRSVYLAQHRHYDIAINLDKDQEACMLLADVQAPEKYGFIWKDNHIDLATPAAAHKLITGLFDEFSQLNTKSYMQEIFEICALEPFAHEPYLLNVNSALVEKWHSLRQLAEGKKIIGLNTGCGKRWLTRLWPSESWTALIQMLQKAGYFPVLLGGVDEHEMNMNYHQATGAHYPGTYSLQEFIAITAQCDAIVTAVSMMMHIALALGKPMILFNNIFNKYEFDLNGNGQIIGPETGCDCYYGNTCSRSRHCMRDIEPATVFNAIQTHLPIPV